MIEASCHCGAVRFAVPTAPEDLNDCACSICRRYGTLWAYYALDEVDRPADNGPTDVYVWGDRELEFHRCHSCGCVVWWAPVDRGRNRMGVNGRLFPAETLALTPVRHTSGPD